ncbi:MAG: fibronectin type III domain-containing protein [Candidatus Latescibacterota bacterium]|nr:fibronectin type III domain-containing protein [Candidatus Latescibacterota bacterium]
MKSQIVFLIVCILNVGCGDDKKSPIDSHEVSLLEAPILRLESIGDGEVRLLWSAVSSDYDLLYKVFRSSEDGEDATPISDSISGTEFTDRGLEYTTEYSYRVAAVDKFGRFGEWSNTVSGQPFNNRTPESPLKLRAVAHNIPLIGKLDISLDWDENSEADLVGYRVYRSQVEQVNPTAKNLLVEVVDARYVDQTVEVGETYFYAITAVDRGAKESPMSSVASDSPLNLPSLVSPIEGALIETPVVFRWNSVPKATGYRVVVTTSPTSGEISEIELTPDTTVAFVGRLLSKNQRMELESGAIYYWKVIASTQNTGVENTVSSITNFKVR